MIVCLGLNGSGRFPRSPLARILYEMTFTDFYIDSFELRLEFSPVEFDSDAFLKAVAERGTKIETHDGGDTDVGFSFGSLDQSVTHHAHLRVRLKKSGSGRAEISYRSGSLEDEKEQPPYIEDCAEWFGGFVKAEKVLAHIHVNYTFDKSFSPVLPLPFPLVTSEKALAGASVTGVALVLPNDEGLSRTVIIQGGAEETFIFLRMDNNIDLKSFDLFSELKTLSGVINPLIKKQESSNDRSTTPRAE